MEFFPAVVTPLPLLLDRVVEYEAGKRAVGIKSVTKNEPFFNGNYPAGRPSMPGFLQVEALAQLAAIVALQIDRLEPGGAFFFFSGAADGITWKQPVVPGDVLVMEVEIKNWNQRFGIGKAEGKAYVDGIIVVQVKEMTFAILLNKQNGPP
jgi:3-hydroxyacyl-[acyl-carrier-protein] dehydratase